MTDGASSKQKTEVTILHLTIEDVPWQHGFDFRVGIDAVTGLTMGTALQPAKPSGENALTGVYQPSVRWIKQDSDFEQELKVNVSGQYNLDGVTLSASAGYLSAVRYSASSMTLVASSTAQAKDYDRLPRQTPKQLTADAAKSFANPLAFREAFGDYYISGGWRQATFYAVYACQAQSSSSLAKFDATIGAQAPEVFSAQGSTALTTAASENNVDLSVSVFMSEHPPGVSGVYLTPAEVIDALTKFSNEATGTYVLAELSHYQHLDSKYSNAIELPVGFWDSLSDLQTAYTEVAQLYDSFSSISQSQFKSTFNALEVDYQRELTSFQYQPQLMGQLLQRAETLDQSLDQINQRMEFYRDLAALKAISGTTDDTTIDTNDDDAPKVQHIGFTSAPADKPAVVITTATVPYNRESDDWTGWNNDLGWEIDWQGNQQLIVGFEITRDWDNLGGYISQAPGSSALLEDSMSLFVQPDGDRGCAWTLTVYTVDAADYDFQDAVATHER